MVVLSLFDALGTNYAALKGAGINVSRYIASERSVKLMKYSRERVGIIEHLGDIHKLSKGDIPDVDIVIANDFFKRERNESDVLLDKALELLSDLNPRYIIFTERKRMDDAREASLTKKLGLERVSLNDADFSPRFVHRSVWANFEILAHSDINRQLASDFMELDIKRVDPSLFVDNCYVEYDMGKGYPVRIDRTDFYEGIDTDFILTGKDIIESHYNNSSDEDRFLIDESCLRTPCNLGRVIRAGKNKMVQGTSVFYHGGKATCPNIKLTGDGSLTGMYLVPDLRNPKKNRVVYRIRRLSALEVGKMSGYPAEYYDNDTLGLFDTVSRLSGVPPYDMMVHLLRSMKMQMLMDGVCDV